MATVELAAALPVLVLLITVGIGGVRVADARVRCQDAAREGARAAARGDPNASAEAGRVAPDGAQVQVARSGEQIEVNVGIAVHVVGGTGPAITVRARATALTEPGTVP